jgi:hypothetical protein
LPVFCGASVLPFPEYVCGDKGVKCSWGRAINVANRYVYATQPERDRIIIISKVQMVVVDVSNFSLFTAPNILLIFTSLDLGC